MKQLGDTRVVDLLALCHLSDDVRLTTNDIYKKNGADSIARS
jgi:hypothetical protein